MSVLLESMIADVREESGLLSNQLFTNAKIANFCTDGLKKLHDKFAASWAGWFRKSYRFSLSGGVTGNTLDLSLIPDLEIDQYLNRNPDSAQPEPVDRLPSIAERSYASGVIAPFARRKYDTDGDVLTVYPADQSSGDYELFYTPQTKPFAIPSTPPPRTVSLNTGDVVAAIGRWTFPAAGTFTQSDVGSSFTVAGASNTANNGTRVIEAISGDQTVYTSTTGLISETFGIAVTSSIQQLNTATRSIDVDASDIYNPSEKSWVLLNAGFTPSDVGAVITIELDGANRAANGEYKIAAVLSQFKVIVNSLSSFAPVNPYSGTARIDRRQLGTIYELPNVLSPFELYIKLYAAMEIKIARDEIVTDIERRFLAEDVRITQMAKTRTQGVRQAPITRRRGFAASYGSR